MVYMVYLPSFNANYFFAYIAMILATVLTILIHRYWKYRRSFTGLPTISYEPLYVQMIIRSCYSRSCTGFYFNEIISIIKRFEKEGICLLWAVKPILLVFNDEYTKIFSTERSTADKAPFIYSVLQEMIGKGLVTTNGAMWKETRKMLNPAFRFDRLKVSIPLINDGAHIIVKRLEEHCNKPTTEVTNILKLGSLKILCGSMLGLDVNAEKYDLKMRRYLELLNVIWYVEQNGSKVFVQIPMLNDKIIRGTVMTLNKVTHGFLRLKEVSQALEEIVLQSNFAVLQRGVLATYTMYRISRPWLLWRATNLLFPTGWRHRKFYKEFHAFTNDLVKEMMHNYESSPPENSNSSNGDSEEGNGGKLFVQILLDLYKKDPTFKLQNIKDEVASIIFGGHDTSAYTLLWTLYMLGYYPEIQKRAYEEAEAAIGDSKDYTYSDLSKLTYLECVIKETLRLYPTVPLFGRMVDRDIEFGKYKILKNTVIGFAPYMLHRNPEYFPDPEKFDPDRFAGNDVKPWTYIPFSEGMRSCIGKKYGMLVLKIVLSHILLNFGIKSLDRREDIQYDWNILLVPTKPLRFTLTPRNSQSPITA